MAKKDKEPKEPKESKDTAAGHKREKLQDIINAVAEKENVLTAFRGVKKAPPGIAGREPAFGLRYLLWNFAGGLVFALGILLMFIVSRWLYVHFYEVRMIAVLFGKLAVTLLRLLSR